MEYIVECVSLWRFNILTYDYIYLFNRETHSNIERLIRDDVCMRPKTNRCIVTWLMQGVLARVDLNRALSPSPARQSFVKETLIYSDKTDLFSCIATA